MGLIGNLSRNPDLDTDLLASHLTDPGVNMRFREQELAPRSKRSFAGPRSLMTNSAPR